MKTFLLLLSVCCLTYTIGLGQTSDAQNSTNEELSFVSLEDAGFNRIEIDNLLTDVYDMARKDLRGIVVIKNDQIVLEEYYNTFWRKMIHDVRSAGKSITTLLLGVAIKEGLIESLDQSVYSLFSEEKNPSINKDYKKIKLRHLLDMSSGLDADTDNSETLGHVGRWIASDDWKSYLLNVPLIAQPGKDFVYADIHAVLIGLAIEEASGMSLKDYAQQKLFGPLGFEPGYWYTNPANQTGAAGNIHLTTYDFAKLGMLILNKGAWNGQQIIDPGYIEEVINSKNLDISDYWNIADSYGMMWYKASRTYDGKAFDYLFAAGSGGNQLIVVPDEKMVIAITSAAYGRGYGHRRSSFIMRRILTALE